MTRRLGILGVALLAIVAVPREGSAGIGDFIWEMSGPQMVGLGVGCRWNNQELHCSLGGGVASKVAANWVPAKVKLPSPYYFGLGGAVYVSTSRDSGDGAYKFDAFRNFMVALEPTLDLRSFKSENGNVKLYHGLGGLTLNYMFGFPHTPFFKAGIKLTPVEVEYKRWSVGVNVRLYPDGFTPDQFDVGPRTHDKDRPSEYTFGIGFSRVFLSRP